MDPATKLKITLSLFPSILPPILRSFVRSFVRYFYPSFLSSFLPSLLPSFLPSFLASLLLSFLPPFLPSFLPSFYPCFFVPLIVRSSFDSFLPLSFRPRFPIQLSSLFSHLLPKQLLCCYCWHDLTQAVVYIPDLVAVGIQWEAVGSQRPVVGSLW